MNLNKNAKTYLIKYIKTQNPNNQQEKQTTKQKQRFHREENNKTTLDKQEKNIH